MSSFGKTESLKENCNKFVRGKGKIFSSNDTVMNVKLHSIQWRKQLVKQRPHFQNMLRTKHSQRLTRKRQRVHREHGQRPEEEFHRRDMADKDKESYLLHLIKIKPHIRHCYSSTVWLKGKKKNNGTKLTQVCRTQHYPLPPWP